MNTTPKEGADELSAADTFRMLWESLVDLLGQAAAAVLIRRAAERAVSASPELAELVIQRGNLEYRYTLPRAWGQASRAALRWLIGALRPMLVELTGPIAVGRLSRVPELRELMMEPA